MREHQSLGQHRLWFRQKNVLICFFQRIAVITSSKNKRSYLNVKLGRCWGVLLTEPGIPGRHSAVLSFTFTLQLLSPQTGHPSHVVTNFCQRGSRKRGVKGTRRPSGKWWIWDVARFTQSRNGTDGKRRVLEHDFVCLVGSLYGNHTRVLLQSFNVGRR